MVFSDGPKVDESLDVSTEGADIVEDHAHGALIVHVGTGFRLTMGRGRICHGSL